MGLLNKKLNFIIFQVSVTKQVSSFDTFNLIVEIGSSLGIIFASIYFFYICQCNIHRKQNKTFKNCFKL